MNPSSPFYRYVPAISIDGAPLAQLGTGPTLISLPAGRHELTVGVGSNVTTRFHYGRAHIAVTVVPHQTTTVYYRAPWTSLSHGTIGFTPQEASDTLPAALLIGCAIAAMLIGVLVTLL